MNKKDVIRIIVHCASQYEKDFIGRNFAIVYDKLCLDFIQTKFTTSCFLHLMGIDTELNANVFYNKCIGGTLSFSDFNIKENGTTQLKMQILPNLFSVNKYYKMIGDYNCNKPKLLTERLAGGEFCCMGFVKDASGYYVPNTTLKEDIRNCVIETKQILAILSKNMQDDRYDNFLYKAKKIDEAAILNKVNFNSAINSK